MPTVLPRTPIAKMTVKSTGLPPLGSLIRKRACSQGPSRCLFGVPDTQESITIAKTEILSEQSRLSTKYNFDFETSTPLSGDFQYEDNTLGFNNENHINEIMEKILEKCEKSKALDQEKTKVCSQKNMTHFFGINRKRSCPFKDQIEDSLMAKKKSPLSSATNHSRPALQSVN